MRLRLLLFQQFVLVGNVESRHPIVLLLLLLLGFLEFRCLLETAQIRENLTSVHTLQIDAEQ
jgi:hypothetical protein